MTKSDRIEKNVLLRAPRSRVWRALTDADEFGSWFGVKLGIGFAVGEHATGKITHPGYEHLRWKSIVERMEAESSSRSAGTPTRPTRKSTIRPSPRTLVEFRLEEVEDGTRLSVVESGFDQIPPERRADAFRSNSAGWAQQMESIKRHVSG